MKKKLRIAIISHCDRLRFQSHINHSLYAERHGYTYIFDISPTRQGLFKNKIEKILKFLPVYDYVFWIDDDAFFSNMDIKLETFIERSDKNLLICKSPVSGDRWTFINSGCMFIKNSHDSKTFLEDVAKFPRKKLDKYWDKNVYGLETRGEQGIIIHLLHTKYGADFYERFEYTDFNARPSDFKKRKDHFIVHFAGGDKIGDIDSFSSKFRLTRSLVKPREVTKLHGLYLPTSSNQ